MQINLNMGHTLYKGRTILQEACIQNNLSMVKVHLSYQQKHKINCHIDMNKTLDVK